MNCVAPFPERSITWLRTVVTAAWVQLGYHSISHTALVKPVDVQGTITTARTG